MNVVGFGGWHMEGQVLMKLEISSSGAGCVIQVKTDASDELA